PAGSTINSATLTLYMNRTSIGPQPIAVHRVIASWGEGTSVGSGQGGGGGTATAGDATWLHRFYPDVFWAVPGGEFVPAASDSIAVGDVGYYTWNAGSLAADVQAWVDNPAMNFGWMLRGDESTLQTSKRFASREASSPSRRPKLEIDFTPPAGTGACCLHGTHCELLDEAQCMAQSGTFMGVGTTCAV